MTLNKVLFDLEELISYPKTTLLRDTSNEVSAETVPSSSGQGTDKGLVLGKTTN